MNGYATITPAAPGYYVLGVLMDGTGRVDGLVKTDILGWAVNDESTVTPVTLMGFGESSVGGLAILCPDGHIHFDDGSRLESEAEYVAELNREQRLAA